ncbi:MAG: hypothetical protein KC416_09685, partial [Myxococcales bacterium]|nr:hypothetical protein [Myxococcales bacterium]
RGDWNGWGVNGRFSCADATVAIGIFVDDESVLAEGIEEFRRQMPASVHLVGDDTSAYTNLSGLPVPPQGTIYDKADIPASTIHGLWFSPTKYVDGFAGETCRDMSHTMMGLGAMANLAEAARNQGIDLYGEVEQRLVAAYELHAGYIVDALDNKPPSSNWVCNTAINMGGTGYRLGWEVAYNHFAGRRGLSLPKSQGLVQRIRPSGTGLHMNWETLTHGGTP